VSFEHSTRTRICHNCGATLYGLVQRCYKCRADITGSAFIEVGNPAPEVVKTLQTARQIQQTALESFKHNTVNLFLFPLRLLWNIIVIAGAVGLEIIWIGFLFGSVVGVVLMLIFFPEGFLLPLGLLTGVTKLWPELEKAANNPLQPTA